MNETDSQGLWFRSVPGATGNLCKPTKCRLSTGEVQRRLATSSNDKWGGEYTFQRRPCACRAEALVVRNSYSEWSMILSYRDKDTEALDVHGVCHRRWRSFQAAAMRKLDMLNAASVVSDLRSPPGNRLEKLSGDREGLWSIRINDQWHICSRWDGVGPEDVEIVDYH